MQLDPDNLVMVDGVRIEAEGLGIRTKRGPVFQDVSFSSSPGDVVAVCGPGGSGRTSLLLTLSGRMRLSTGTLAIDGRTLPTDSKWVRRNSSVCAGADIDPLVENMRVSEEYRRAELFAGARHARKLTRDQVFDLVDLKCDPHSLVSDLDAPDRTRLRLALGLVVQVPLLLLDGLGQEVPASGHHRLWTAVRRCVDATGVTLVASTLESGPAVDHADVVVNLPASVGPREA